MLRVGKQEEKLIMKAIIIGAGIGGLCTAIALQQSGIETLIYERAPKLEALGAGLALWSNALQVLDSFGVGTAIAEMGAFNGQGAIRSHRGKSLVQVASNDTHNSESIRSIAVHRAELMNILLEQAGNVIKLGHEFTHYQQNSEGITVHFSNGNSDSVDMLIGADGIHSKVRARMHPESQAKYSGYTVWRGLVPFEHRRMNGVFGETWGNGQRFGMMPINNDRVYWFATENVPAGKRYSVQETKTHVQNLFASWHDPIPALLKATDAAEILHHDIYDIDPIEAWVEGRVALLGDAAHAMTPNMGQGACQAIEDAYALGTVLGKKTLQNALAHYQNIRMPRVHQIMSRSRQIGQVGQIENPAICWLRNQVVKNMPVAIRNRALNSVIDYDIRSTLA
jgi:2-polyprenyl-6-methoxyphenol hydroxylase-like FAD-dependent oxidoreductase